MLFQSCMSLFLLLNTKEAILKNVGNQTVLGITDFHITDKISMEVNGDQKLLGYQHSSKNLLIFTLMVMTEFSFLGELSL